MNLKNPFTLIGIVAGLSLATANSAPDTSANPKAPVAGKQMAEGDGLFARGEFELAAQRWQDASRVFEKAHDRDSQLGALLRQASACYALGQHKLALSILDTAAELAKSTSNQRRSAEITAARGGMAIFSRDAGEAEPLLRESLKQARAQKNTALTATVLNDLGILLAAQGKSTEAIAAFEEAARIAMREGQSALTAKAHKNMADAALTAKDFAGAKTRATQAAKSAASLPDGHDKAYLLMGAGEILRRLFLEAPEHDNALRAQAFHLHQEAAEIATRTGDQRALSYALGYQGALYEFEKRPAEALALTRRALACAQRAQSPDALYRWQWQSGRLLAQTGERQAAIEAYRRAVVTLQSIRNDVAIRYGNSSAGSSFREAAGAVYFELADLLLQSADGQNSQALLREARDTAEMLKSAELEDYFQDDCVNLLKAKIKKVERLSPTAAVVYIIPLPDRTEMLVSLPSGELERIKSSMGSEALTAIVRRFRLNLEDRTTIAYLEQSRQLYTALIKPLEALMSKYHLDTMVFVPDGALRTIPMAALNDGEHFLVEKYAVAVSPGLELMEAKPVARATANIMISALSQSVQGFPPLQHVSEEVANLEKIYGQQGAMMNEKFLRSSVAKKLSEEEYTIVHIASHGHFDNDVRKSFVLTFDKQLTLDDLERYIRPAQLRDHPLEMLTLSACQTAAGDDRAALGLAGVAVKAGARSAFATLWFVNDQASTEVISHFYRELVTRPGRTKAQALQSAQKMLLAQERYQHPCYWAPYLIIGNWL